MAYMILVNSVITSMIPCGVKFNCRVILSLSRYVDLDELEVGHGNYGLL